jgi:hypothetical protein
MIKSVPKLHELDRLMISGDTRKRGTMEAFCFSLYHVVPVNTTSCGDKLLDGHSYALFFYNVRGKGSDLSFSNLHLLDEDKLFLIQEIELVNWDDCLADLIMEFRIDDSIYYSDNFPRSKTVISPNIDVTDKNILSIKLNCKDPVGFSFSTKKYVGVKLNGLLYRPITQKGQP